MKQSRPCIFCGGAGLSKEHLFADWLRELFPRTNKDMHTFGTTKMWPNYTVERKQGHSGSKKIREVCTVCNNGWISDLDNHAKLIASELIVGKPLRVNPDRQRTLATWLAKISMVGDHIERQRSKVSQEHRSYLRDNLSPPSTWQIWVSSYGGLRWHHLRMEQFRSALELPNRPKTYFVSNVIGMGAMLALVLGHGLRASNST